MGVLACDRRNCDHVMCDRYSKAYGYICNHCFDELVNKGPEQNITEFMCSIRIKGIDLEAEAKARYSIVFPIIRD